MSFKNQIGQINPDAIDDATIQADFEQYGVAKCNQLGPAQCKCDCNNDGTEDFSVPLPSTGVGGNWVPNYPQPLSLIHAIRINWLCCYQMCYTECFGEQEGLSGYDDEISGGSVGGSSEGDDDVFDGDITEGLTGTKKFSVFEGGLFSSPSPSPMPQKSSQRPTPSRTPSRTPQPTRPPRRRRNQRGGLGSFVTGLFS